MTRKRKRQAKGERSAKRGTHSRVPDPETVPVIAPEHFAPGTLGVAVFGPGKGEAIVVRLPDKRIGVVDGCREPRSGNHHGHGDPVRELLAAFAEYGGDPVAAQRLAFVCLTHPHDDHYAGLGRMMDAYSGRIERLWMPPDSARYQKDLLTYLDKTRDDTTNLLDAGELKGLARVIEQQDQLIDLPDVEFHIARAGVRAMREFGKRRCCGRELEITMCSPTDRDIHFASRHLTESIKNVLNGLRGTHYPNPDPNVISASLLIRWGKAKVLLAGDLLSGTNKYGGWGEAGKLINGPVQVVNVAHHASSGAHDAELWARMKPKLAIVTPYRRAKENNPPRPEMVRQLLESGAKVVITSPPDWPSDELQGFEWSRPLDDSGSGNAVPMKNCAISATKASGYSDRNNAVAVSLNSDGSIGRLVLGGQARMVRLP